jgi:adenosylhomocysteine nucleosidase
MIGMIFATGMEARPFLTLAGAELYVSRPFRLYCAAGFSRLPVIISGIGKVAAALACQSMILRYGVTHVLNAGVVGALHDGPEFEVCRLVRIESAVEGDHTVFGRRPAPLMSSGRFGRGLPPARLVTSDEPVFDPDGREAFGQLGQVVDMEGAAIARTAELYGVPWDMIKGVSDLAGPVERETLRRNLFEASDTIARRVWQELKDSTDR